MQNLKSYLNEISLTWYFQLQQKYPETLQVIEKNGRGGGNRSISSKIVSWYEIFQIDNSRRGKFCKLNNIT